MPSSVPTKALILTPPTLDSSSSTSSIGVSDELCVGVVVSTSVIITNVVPGARRWVVVAKFRGLRAYKLALKRCTAFVRVSARTLTVPINSLSRSGKQTEATITSSLHTLSPPTITCRVPVHCVLWLSRRSGRRRRDHLHQRSLRRPMHLP